MHELSSDLDLCLCLCPSVEQAMLQAGISRGDTPSSPLCSLAAASRFKAP